MTVRLISMFLLMLINSAFAGEETIFEHQYKLSKKNINFATSYNILLKNDDKKIFKIKSKSSGIFKLKKDNRLEESVFLDNDGKITPISYNFHKIQKVKEEKISTIFDLKNNSAYTIKNNKKIEHKNILYALDRLSVQIDFQKKIKSGHFDVEYNVIDKGRIRKYIFSLFNGEIIDTILGKTNTIVIKKIIVRNKRNTLTWYAVDHDFIPVKIEQYRNNSLKFTVKLNKIIK